jgi:ketosteroid isomerase-like protein
VAAWDFYVKVVEAFERDSVSDAEVVDARADTVLVHQHNDMRGRASGAKVEIDYWILVTFRDGKIVRDEWFANHAEALEALGSPE